jgi:hypothetical protein
MRQVHDYENRSSGHSLHVELMVHGVGGTPPESMLDSGEIVRVRGDTTAAFFRLKHPDSDCRYVQEAYSWGGLTAGSASRAFWVFLAPFAFLNVAGWMLPPASSDTNSEDVSAYHGVATGLLRLIGLTVTVHAIIWIGQMAIDFAAWQCGGDVSCRSTTWFVSVFGWEWFDGAPARRLVVGALIPLIVILVLYRLTRRTVDRYETVDEDALEDYKAVGRDSFADPTFWRRGSSLSSFASLHLAAGGAGLAWVLAWTFAWLQPTGTPWVQITIGWLALVLLIVSAASITVVRDPSPTTDDSSQGRLETIVAWHRRATVAVVVVTLVVGVLWPGYQDPGRNTPLDPYAEVWRWIWIVSILTLVAFAVVVLTHPNRTRSIAAPLAPKGADDRVVVGFGSFGSVVAAFFGFLVAVAILGGFGAATARLLGGRPAILSTYLYDAFGLITTAWVLLLFVAFVVTWLLRKPQHIPQNTTSASEFEKDITDGFREDVRSFFTGHQRKRKWLVSIRTARDVRAFVPVVESILGWMVIVAMLVAIVLLGVQSVVPDTLQSVIESLPSPLLTASTWFVAVGIPVGMIWAIRRAYGSQQARRLIGTLWDVVTFWPRWFHPLAPPSYSGRAIPELRTRIDTLVSGGVGADGKATVVVTAHSQGSVLALAALDGFEGQDWLGHVSLLTHGSPITRLYVRLFPAHMVDPISRVLGLLDNKRWVNMYRLTDPIGGAISGETLTSRRGSWQPETGLPLNAEIPDVTSTLHNPVSDPDLRLFADPSDDPHVYPKKGDPYPQPLGHSDYNRAPEFKASLRSLLGLPD